ncbi:WG repeat-containing protein [Paenibacillus oenotherae]|uniref:WG repeat-containing protein n=1 Tax=Paenibacillus oenotherae TaxID=1435645 RepID=A0ABS7D960_9BACL|nr:WG repeat-containing protein [Paenibacillus oenotherae]MBW7476067.1 WG repeat-containing protein [Paenibacillus oenotherae]
MLEHNAAKARLGYKMKLRTARRRLIMKKLLISSLLALTLLGTSGAASFAAGTSKEIAAAPASQEKLYRIEKDGKFGFINVKGQIIIEPKYSIAVNEQGNPAYVVADGKQIYYDAAGNKLFECPLNQCRYISDGMAVYQKKIMMEDGTYQTRYGYLNVKGEQVTEAIYHHASPFSDGLARVNMGKASGYIDKTGRLVIPYRFSSTTEFSEGRAVVQLQAGGKYAYIDKTGKLITPAIYAHAGPFSDGAALVYVDGKYGYIDGTGKMFITPQFSAAWAFSDGLAAVERNGRTFYINKQGKKVIYFGGGQFVNGLAPASQGQQHGYIDRTGKFVIKPAYMWADSFVGELAKVYLESKTAELGFVEGYINRKGELVWKP